MSIGSLGWVPPSKEPRLRPGLPRVSRSRITPRVGNTIQKEHRIGPHNGGPNLHAQLPHQDAAGLALACRHHGLPQMLGTKICSARQQMLQGWAAFTKPAES